jgi:hypothetical protein
MLWHVAQHHRISPNLRMRSHANIPQQFCSGPHIDVAFQHWCFCAAPRAKGHLLKKQAIRADFGSGVNHYSIRMRQQQTALNLAVQRNIGPTYCTPKSVTQHGPTAKQGGQQMAAGTVFLVGADACQQTFTWVPLPGTFVFTAPVRHGTAYVWLHASTFLGLMTAGTP